MGGRDIGFLDARPAFLSQWAEKTAQTPRVLRRNALAANPDPIKVSPVSARLTVLGSGSSGNCAYLETDEVRLLIDAGLSGRQIRQRLLSIGRTPENLDGILITHEHTDHTQGLNGLAKLNLPVYCNRLTKESIEEQITSRLNFRLFSTGASFEIADVQVDTFSIPHDAYDPVGFLVHTSTARFGFLTDLGHATRLVVDRMRGVHALVLEANYDLKLLQEDTRRPWSTKQRIMSRHGHLSNHSAAELMEKIVSADLRHVFLAHLSSDCNKPELAEETVGTCLGRLGATHIRLQSTTQAIPSETLELA